MVSNKGPVWAPCFLLTMHPSYSRFLEISFHTHTATLTTRKSTWASSLTVARPRRMQFVWGNVVSRKSGAGWSRTDSLLMMIRPSLQVIIGTRQQVCKLQSMNIEVGSSEIKHSSRVRNGCCLNPNLYVCDHITNVCKTAFYYLHNIRRIKKYLSRNSLLNLVHAFITSRLDY